MFLLDTNVISELRKPHPKPAVLAWFEQVEAEDIHISAMTIGEIQRGIAMQRGHDYKLELELREWLEDEVLMWFEPLPFDTAAAREWGRLMAHKKAKLAQDAVIAAIANVNGLQVVTRNVDDFHALGIEVLNPFEHVG